MGKLRSVCLLVLACSGANLFAQRPLTIYEDSILFKGSRYPGFVAVIPEFDSEQVQKNWIKELQSGTKSKVVTENHQMTIFGANIKEISANPVNIYSEIADHDTALVLYVSFETAKQKYVEKVVNENEAVQARSFLKDFAKEQYVEKVEDELKAENRNLRELEKQLESLRNKKTGMQKSIQSDKADIAQANDNISVTKSEIEKLTAELVEQNGQLLAMQAGAVKDEKTNYIKDIEKRKKKAFNEVESLEKKIVKLNSEIDQYDDEIKKNEASQEDMKGKIAGQEPIVKKCQEKLAKVKAL